MTPLHTAAGYGFTEGVQEIITQAPDPRALLELVDASGRTPLGLARSGGHVDTVQLLEMQ